MPIPLPIETERLLVRPFAPEPDARAMAEIYCDPEVMRFIPGGALADEKAVRSLLERYADAQDRQGFSSWAVVERRTGRLIGDVGLGIFKPTGDIELGLHPHARLLGARVRERGGESLSDCGAGPSRRIEDRRRRRSGERGVAARP